MTSHSDLFDAAVLTGVNHNTSVINKNSLVRSFVPRVAPLRNTDRFGEFDTIAMAGKNDYAICDGECEGVYDEAARQVFKNAKPCMPYLHPHSSHNLNFHHNAIGAFNVMTDFLDAHL
ncbi:hypothetical protein GGR55DRAFT_691000 [Xylaria sp. FL0064]|nr:hypothetical protein GGR55DRAFT_691000 [Xylaria sp. FL0064]